MAQQPWIIGAGSTNLHSDFDPAPATPEGVSKPLPPDVVLLGPRDERDQRPGTAPSLAKLEAKSDKPDLRPAPASYMPAPRKSHRTKRTVIGLSALVLVCVGIPSIAYLR
jgi:hypothetical protein